MQQLELNMTSNILEYATEIKRVLFKIILFTWKHNNNGYETNNNNRNQQCRI